ncbi:MAG: 16S rRNA (adenine(1518)-N(6)/adenine(1519)-N(6))-dimethyltransferase RsmA [Phycisphaerae bacterium]|nr:16S rRNA (adenine(1518)-N(6)/adenine(1519)-N(6))-dimethyltransferase RsmA [Phycisphaerae bacterium]
MQTLTEIRQLLQSADLAPRRRWGQCFLIDGNLMAKLLELAEVPAGQAVLEVGAGTGSLSEELLARGANVLAVEVDPGLCRLLRQRLGGREGFTLIEADALAGRAGLSAAVREALPPVAHLVANLPYSIATPLVAECLVSSWRARAGQEGHCRFERMTVTVQREVADRLGASPSSRDYGPVSVLVALLGRLRLGSVVPASAFWPSPKVTSRMVRIDFDPAAAAALRSIETLRALLRVAFGQRRKQIGSILRRRPGGFDADALAAAVAQAGIDPSLRGEAITPAQYLAAANAMG